MNTVSETFATVNLPHLLAQPSDILAASLLTPATLRPSTLSGFVMLSVLSLSAMLGFAVCQETNRPGRRHIVDKEIGCTLPGRWSTTLPDPVFRWGLQQHLGLDALGAGEPCGKRCNHILDLLGRHAGLCNKSLYSRRHERVSDHMALVASQARLTAQTEQNKCVQGQTLEDGEPAPGSVRPVHRADLHIIEPSGSELWLDVRTHTHPGPAPTGGA